MSIGSLLDCILMAAQAVTICNLNPPDARTFRRFRGIGNLRVSCFQLFCLKLKSLLDDVPVKFASVRI